MSKWMKELDELMKGLKGGKNAPANAKEDDDEDDEFDGAEHDGDDEGDGEGDGMTKGAGSRKGCYEPADNGDDDDQPEGAAVRDPEKIERKTKSNKISKPAGVNAGSEHGKVAKSVRDLVDEDASDMIDAAHTLGQIADAVDNLVGEVVTRINKSLKRINARFDEVEAAQALIGRAVTKSLQGNGQILKSLQGEVEDLARQPAGRKAVTKGVERKFAGNDQGGSPQPDRNVIVTKSLEAMKAGRITQIESSKIDPYLNRFGRLPDELWAKINGSGS